MDQETVCQGEGCRGRQAGGGRRKAGEWDCPLCHHKNPPETPTCDNPASCVGLQPALLATERALVGALDPSDWLHREWSQLRAAGAADLLVLQTVQQALREPGVNFSPDEPYNVVWNFAGLDDVAEIELWLCTDDEWTPGEPPPQRPPDLPPDKLVGEATETMTPAHWRQLRAALESTTAHRGSWNGFTAAEMEAIEDADLTGLIREALAEHRHNRLTCKAGEVCWTLGPEPGDAGAIGIWFDRLQPADGMSAPERIRPLSSDRLLAAVRQLYGTLPPDDGAITRDVPREKIEALIDSHSADTMLDRCTIRRPVEIDAKLYICTGGESSGRDGWKRVVYYQVVPRTDFRGEVATPQTIYAEAQDRRESGRFYDRLAVRCGSKQYVVAGPELSSTAYGVRKIAETQGKGSRAQAKPKAVRNAASAWADAHIALLGTVPDGELAKQIGRSTRAVAVKRQILGIPACTESAEDRSTAKPSTRQEAPVTKSAKKKPAKKKSAKKKPASNKPAGPKVSQRTVVFQEQHKRAYGGQIVWRVVLCEIDGSEFFAFENADGLDRDALGEPFWNPVNLADDDFRRLIPDL